MNSISNRRTFLKAGALLAAPVAVPAAAAAAVTSGDAEARLARREDEAAIRAMHDGWLRLLNTQPAERAQLDEALCSVTADLDGEPDRIVIAEDGRRASGRFHWMVELESAIPTDFTLGQMAHAQGSGFVRRHERRVAEVAYVKVKDGWAIASTGFASA